MRDPIASMDGPLSFEAGKLLTLFHRLDESGARQLSKQVIMEKLASLEGLTPSGLKLLQDVTKRMDGDQVQYDDLRDVLMELGMKPEIQLWRKPAIPFEGESTHRKEYLAHELPRREASKPLSYSGNGFAFDGKSTSKEAYVEWPLPQTKQTTGARQAVHTSLPFEGESTHRSQYTWHDVPRRNATVKPAYEAPAYRFDGTTTTASTYRSIQLPRGPLPALGVLFRSNQAGTSDTDFLPIIRAGAELPAVGAQTFTTVLNAQAHAAIRVVAEVHGKRLEIGTLELDMLRNEACGIPMISVELAVDNCNVLTVSATDLTDGRKSQITIPNSRIPAQAADALGTVDLAGETFKRKQLLQASRSPRGATASCNH